MVARILVRLAQVVGRLVVRSEELVVSIGVFETHRLIGEVPQCLVLLYGPGDFLTDLGCDHLRTPVAVVAAQQRAIGDVVQQAGHHYFFVLTAVQCQLGGLQQVHISDV